jgi:hypothetical protein
VDGSKARVVLNVLVTGAEVTEILPLLEMLFRSTFRWGLRPRSVTGDAAYGSDTEPYRKVLSKRAIWVSCSSGRPRNGTDRGGSG